MNSTQQITISREMLNKVHNAHPFITSDLSRTDLAPPQKAFNSTRPMELVREDG
jgi:hypothetical protein